MPKYKKQRLGFVWEQFGPYHMDRCEAVSKHLGDAFEVIGLEIAGSSRTYEWEQTGSGENFTKETLFPGRIFEETWFWPRLVRLVGHCIKGRIKHLFLCHYERPEIFLLALLMRLLGRRVYVMQASKFDDKQRFLLRELGKRVLYIPYHGAIVGSDRTRSYLRFLGFRDDRLFPGYDTVSVDRIRRLAGAPPAPAGMPYPRRHFTIIARLVAKKNIPMAIAAYEIHRDEAGADVRDLHICGSGELEGELRLDVERRGLEGVKFLGFLQAEGVARLLGTTLALILPSTEEQWGLVINEALAMGVPILCSDRVGARDSLVRVGVNGYVFEPDNVQGLARLMGQIAGDETQWRAFAEAALSFAEKGDATHFAKAVAEMVGAKSAPGG